MQRRAHEFKAGACRPRLYVYELPASYTRVHRTYEHRRNLSFALVDFPAGVKLTSTPMYSLALIFNERALAYRCRTRDPRTADLFYVPASNSEMTQRPSKACAEAASDVAARGGHEGALYQRLRELSGNALSARGGADHLFVNPRVGADYFETHPLCELNLLDPRLGAATRAAVTQKVTYERPCAADGSRTQAAFLVL